MPIYIPGQGRAYQLIHTDSERIASACTRGRGSSNPNEILEALAFPGYTLNPRDYESNWGSSEITKTGSGKNIPQVMGELFEEIEKQREKRQADLALIQDPEVDAARGSSTRVTFKLLLLNKRA